MRITNHPKKPIHSFAVAGRLATPGSNEFTLLLKALEALARP